MAGTAAILLVVVAVIAIRQLTAAPRPDPRPPTAQARAQRRRPHARQTRTPNRRARTTHVPSLALDQLAGQRVLYSYSGLMPPPSLLATVRAGQAAGVVLFGSNVSSPAQAASAVGELQRANASSPVRAPLLILTDQEGGQVRRVPGAPVPSERQIGDAPGGASLAAQSGAAAAATLAAAGVNVNLAPVLDVLREPDDFIDQFGRSYSSDPRQTGVLGSAFIAAQQRHGVAATAKHFPGLGAAPLGSDTDRTPVTLPVPLAQLRSVDELPFRRAIAAGVKLVMTSWAVYPALDPGAPAGLSRRVIEGELRGRLRFRGVTVTDTLSAGALNRYGSLAQRALLAAGAGADLIMCSATADAGQPSDCASVTHAIAAAIARGDLSRVRARQAVARIIGLRRSLGEPPGRAR